MSYKPYQPISSNNSDMSPVENSRRPRPSSRSMLSLAVLLWLQLCQFVSRMLYVQTGEAGLLSASAEPETGCWASAAFTKRIVNATATQVLRVDILSSHLTAERSILAAPQGLRQMQTSLRAPALSSVVSSFRLLLVPCFLSGVRRRSCC